MKILIWVMVVGSCIGNLAYKYQQEINKIYDSQIQFEITQESLTSGSFN